MSEKIYALLLRLFPSHFRKAYGDEALQLFRDRARDEKGLLRRPRLWLDLLADLASSLPREYLHAEPELAGAAIGQHAKGVPTFYVLGDERPRPGALFLGGVLSLGALVAVSVLLTHGGNFRPLLVSTRQSPRGIETRHSALGNAGLPSAKATEESALASGRAQMGASPQTLRTVTNGGTAEPQPGNSNSRGAASAESAAAWQPRAPQPRDADRTTSVTGVDSGTLNAAERKHVISAAIADLKQYYVDRNVAEKMANALEAHAKNGEDDAITDGDAFAHQLTKQMRDVSHDLHLELVYSQGTLPQHPTEETPEAFARYREAMVESHCTLEEVKILNDNIGYLKLNSFPDRSVCESTAREAMATLNHADALIFDLRDNRGGMPDMVALMASYLFDHPEYLYNPRENTTRESWTHSPVPGNKLADKPVYILTSARTFSGAEQFCYDMKMLKRATLVGERTGGAAHSGVFHRIDDHFGMGIPETKAINPFSNADWAETGVEPDVNVKAADALEVAAKIAAKKLQKK
jgi:C-terminal processing protease CtpA/Prc